jgi:hypothetical protein
MMPLDFHVNVLTEADISPPGFSIRQAGEHKVCFDPRESYFGGLTTYVCGPIAEEHFEVLNHHAYTEVGFSFLNSMMKAMIRLYHNLGLVVDDFGGTEELEKMRKHFSSLDEVAKESGERYGKLKQISSNLVNRRKEFSDMMLNDSQKQLAEALEVEHGFEELARDCEYLSTRYHEVLIQRLECVNETLSARLMTHGSKKRGLFG